MILNVDKIVDRLGDAGLIRPYKIRGKYYSIYCPIHKDGQETKASCGILLQDEYKGGQHYPAGWCHCFTCGYAKTLPNLVTDLLKAKNMSGTGLEWLKEHIPGFDGVRDDIEELIPGDMMTDISHKYAIDYILSYTKPKANYVSEEELASYRFTVPYMYERGLTDELIEKYDIGFDGNHIPPGRKKPLPCITFPVRDLSGNTLFFCRRSVEGKYFNYPTDVLKPVYGLYELPEGCTSVVVCESALNALTSIKYGRPAVALLGTGNSYQYNQLRQSGIREFISGFDPDEAGRKATKRMKAALKDVGIVWSFEGIPEGKDINDLSYEEFWNLRLI